MFRPGRVLFDFFAQTADIDGKGIVVHEVSVSVPEFVEDLASGQDPGRIAEKQTDQPVFHPGQLQRCPVEIRFSGCTVYLDRTGTEPHGRVTSFRLVCQRASSEKRADPGAELPQFERFCDVVVSAAVQSPDNAGLFVGCSQEDDGRLISSAPYLAAEAKTGSVGQRDIQQQKVVRMYGK